jgi:ATP-dependent helicase/nuclease subunit A
MWTPDQQSAIDAPNRDILVSAAAGSGKTAVMVERIVSRILQGKVDIDKVLVVTFTNAAASELKSRLMTKIMDAIEKAENPDYLNRQLMLIGTASICTIDSFCLDVLRQNFYKAGLDPSVKVRDGAEVEMIKADVIDKVLEDYYNAQDETFLKLINSYTSKSDKEFAQIILKIYKFSCSLPGGATELSVLKDRFSNNEVWEEYFIKKAHAISQRACRLYDRAIDNAGFGDELKKVKDLLYDEKNNYSLILNAFTWQDVRKAVENMSFGTLRFPKNTEESEKQIIKGPRESAKDLRKELGSMFSFSYDEVCADIQETKLLLDKIIEIVCEFAREFSNEKLSKGIIDFSDVEHLTLKLLQDENGNPGDTARQLMEKYDEIYVDEYQDCNGVQEKLFSLISRANIGNPNMYMVGDMKQSIYGFRGSEPSLFKHKSDIYPMYGEGDGKYNKIVLNKNFRSRRCVIDAVNSIFCQIMSEKCGEMDYTESEYLYYNEDSYKEVNGDMTKVDIALIEMGTDMIESDDTVSDITGELKALEAEAIYVSNKINELVSDENYLVYDKDAKSYRRVKYSDIVILLRSAGDKAETFSAILNTAGIPNYCELKGAYYDTPEVAFVINYLKIIDNPYDDVALLTVMRHAVTGFSDDDFVSIRLSKPKGYFYLSVLSYIKNNNDSLEKRLSLFVKQLNNYCSLSGYLSADKLIWEIVKDTGYMSYLTFTSNAELRKANVRSLINKAHAFEKSSYKGIFDFIRYVDSVKQTDNGVESAKTLSDDEDVVRIMTIHKSKGLEFPVVFLSNVTKQFNDMDLKSDKMLLHKNHGFGLNYYNFLNHFYYELPQKRYIKDIKYKEMYSEEMRVLYVALTRAREKLFITGASKNIYSRIEKLAKAICYDDKLLSEESVRFAKSFSDWILMAVLRNKSLIAKGLKFEFSETFGDGSIFDLKILDKNDIVLNINEKSEVRHFDTDGYKESDMEFVKRVFEFEYPYKDIAELGSNMSVTELKRRENEDDNVYNFYHQQKLVSPNFAMQNSHLSTADIGIATHLVMEKLDFSKVSTKDAIGHQVEELVSNGFLNEAEADAVKCENILRLFSTPLGKMMQKNIATLKREFGFKYLMNANEILKDSKCDESIVVQGMIDAYFEDENGDVVIVDYKTDKVKSKEEIKNRYAPQLKYYKLALEKALNKKVAKTCLFLLDTGEVIEVV